MLASSLLRWSNLGMKLFSLASVIALLALPVSPLSAADAETLFEQKVKPLFAHNCFECHSSQAKELKGNLKVETLDGMLKGGANGPAIIPGDLESSFLLRAIRYQEADYQMPPKGRLADEEIALVEEWVKRLKEPKK